MISRLTNYFSNSASTVAQTEEKEYRPLHAEEKKALKDLLALLSESNMLWLMSDPKEMVECRKELIQTHPLMFIASTVEDYQTRILLKKVYDRGQHFWSPFVNKIFEQVKFQEKHFENITPHLNDFSNRIGLESNKVQAFFKESDPFSLFHELFIKHNKI